jgi:nucleoside-diphosphate-sugar epimerase
MATLVTGATGLIGSHVTRLLVERGDEVRALVRERSPLEALDGLDVELVRGDALERAAVRRAMRGVDRLFHVAGITSLRAGAETHFAVNVTATQIVLEEALRAGVAGVVYTSSVAAIGPAPRGSTADERQVFRAGASVCPTSTPSTRPRAWPCVWPPAACRSSSSTPRTRSGRAIAIARRPSSCAVSCVARSRPTSTVR